jgi:hypothetical protein
MSIGVGIFHICCRCRRYGLSVSAQMQTKRGWLARLGISPDNSDGRRQPLPQRRPSRWATLLACPSRVQPGDHLVTTSTVK